jgi:hypothetical protein
MLLVRVANNRLKAAVFSVSCRVFVRVADKGLAEGEAEDTEQQAV